MTEPAEDLRLEQNLAAARKVIPQEPGPSSLGDALGAMNDAAMSYARKWGLIDADGTVRCIQGCGRPGMLPHLCCPFCIARWREGDRLPAQQSRPVQRVANRSFRDE